MKIPYCPKLFGGIFYAYDQTYMNDTHTKFSYDDKTQVIYGHTEQVFNLHMCIPNNKEDF